MTACSSCLHRRSGATTASLKGSKPSLTVLTAQCHSPSQSWGHSACLEVDRVKRISLKVENSRSANALQLNKHVISFSWLELFGLMICLVNTLRLQVLTNNLQASEENRCDFLFAEVPKSLAAAIVIGDAEAPKYKNKRRDLAWHRAVACN